MPRIITIKTRDGLTIETDKYSTLRDALVGEGVDDTNIRSFKVVGVGDCQPCEAVKEQAQ